LAQTASGPCFSRDGDSSTLFLGRLLQELLWDSVNERVWMVKYQHINVIPHSFAGSYFHSTAGSFVKVVAKKISLPVSSQPRFLEAAAGIVLQSCRVVTRTSNGAVKSRRGGSRTERVHKVMMIGATLAGGRMR